VVRLHDHALSWFPRALGYSADAVQADIFSKCQFGEERLPCASDLQSHGSRGSFLDSLAVSGHPAMLFWIVPLRKALPRAEPERTLISEGAAIRLLRELLASMREVTEELKRIARSKWK